MLSRLSCACILEKHVIKTDIKHWSVVLFSSFCGPFYRVSMFGNAYSVDLYSPWTKNPWTFFPLVADFSVAVFSVDLLTVDRFASSQFAVRKLPNPSLVVFTMIHLLEYVSTLIWIILSTLHHLSWNLTRYGHIQRTTTTTTSIIMCI